MSGENDDGERRDRGGGEPGSDGGSGSGPDSGSGSGGGSGSGRVFLSYNSQDRDEVEAIERALRGLGIDTFIDTAGLEHGKSWVEQIEGAITEASAVLVCLGKHGLGPVHRKEISLACRRRLLQPARGFGLCLIRYAVHRIAMALGLLGLERWSFEAKGDLEQSLIDHLRQLLLEPGRDFCFGDRQLRITSIRAGHCRLSCNRSPSAIQRVHG